MKHLKAILPFNEGQGKNLVVRATGRFYTHPLLVQHLVEALVRSVYFTPLKELRIIDPFCGDGRLLVAFIEQACSLEHCRRNIRWRISAWDCDEAAVRKTKNALRSIIEKLSLDADVDIRCWDSFVRSHRFYGEFDCVITNPPWETLKPDRRELSPLTKADREKYCDSLRHYDKQLASALPKSQPERKFAGWGTNLSRCGMETALRLTADKGFCGIVLPASILTDQMSVSLREWILGEAAFLHVLHYPAEARLFEMVDQACVTAVLTKARMQSYLTTITQYGKDAKIFEKFDLPLTLQSLRALDYCIPIESGRVLLRCIRKWNTFKTFGDLEGKEKEDLWAGRELDETRHTTYLTGSGRYRFIKGRMIDRFRIADESISYVNETLRNMPESADHPRLVWRDVARRSRGRRMQAAIIPQETVTGNSLHVAYFRDDNMVRLKALLAIMNSIPFEFQVRSMLGTGHISLGVIRKIRIPDICNCALSEKLARLVDGLDRDETTLEVVVAKAYRLRRPEYKELLDHFDGIPSEAKEALLSHPLWESVDQEELSRTQALDREPNKRSNFRQNSGRIPNHYSTKLSSNDMKMALAVKPGGNWKDIPIAVPSQRLETIRKSYAAGEGSRSTYYGRLRADKPSYTINTYFNRPGNGCHLHYDYNGGQHRVLSEREAARLQSFPDSFIFYGSHTAINKQIGNAVPPLLAFQIAQRFPSKGYFVDLFGGAGGMSLGFKWAGWEPIVANDIERAFLETYRNNIHDKIVCGDIRDRHIFQAIVTEIRKARKSTKVPLLVLGGPPCQGFSTAGKRRSMEDDRNQLFYEYKKILQAVEPTGFVFENVTGLLNMDGGRVFQIVKDELKACTKNLLAWHLKAEEHGIPQRRSRVILVGHSLALAAIQPPKPVTGFFNQPTLFGGLHPTITVGETLSDLPPLKAGEDGSNLDYKFPPKNPYQKLMRGQITPGEYLESLAEFSLSRLESEAELVHS